jgi:hypothetical protein
MPKQSSFELPVFGRFDGSWLGGTLFTPPLKIELKLPQLKLDIQPSASTTVTMQDNQSWEVFRTVGIVAGSDRGLNLLQPKLVQPVEWGSYPFVDYTDYWISPLSISGSTTSEILLMASRAAERLGAKKSRFKLRTCAHFNSIYGAQCSTKLVSLPLQLTTGQPGGYTYPQYTEPRSTDTGTMPLDVTVHGNNLTIPNQRPLIYLRTPDKQTTFRGPFVRASSTAVTFSFDPAAPVQCGAYRVQVQRGDGANAYNLFNVTRPFRGSPHHLVMEAESGSFGAPLVIDSTTPKASNSRVVKGNGSTGELSLQFRAPATTSCRMWVRAMPHNGVRYFNIELHQVDPPEASFTKKTTMILNPSTSLATQVVKNGSTIATYQLVQGRTYELVLKPATGRRWMSKIDMVILTSGTQTPLNNELCIQ